METKIEQKLKIQILPENLANKIAAGEVVERPASVVKELVENAIDAESTRISVLLKQSGKQSIQIIDDGTGMHAEDMLTAFERHATSKIATDADLTSIETLGFRGEALPSIASVSQVEIVSRTSNDSIATVLRIDGGKKSSTSRKAAPVGTNIQIKNLFFNTPARRNFMRSDHGELQAIINTLKRFFLAYPEIEFELYSDDNLIYALKKGDIGQRVKEVLGEALFPALIPLNESLGGIELSGFISRPDKVRRTRGNQFLFLNGRPIQDKSLNHAVFQGYKNLIGPGEFPTFCLFLELDPNLVDVNVHPTKMEVRFSNDRSLYYFFMTSIRKALNVPGVIPAMSKGNDDSFLARYDEKPKAESDIANELTHRSRYMSRAKGEQLSLVYFESPQKPPSEAPSEKETEEQPVSDVEVQFWQIHNRYILSEIKSGMVIIDQHVAHERILFERILNTLRGAADNYGQQLLFPQSLHLTPDDFMVFEKVKDVLNKIGFGVQEFSGKTVVIDAIPPDVKVGREAQVIMDILDYYKENPNSNFDPHEKMAAAFSCKNAIKSGEKLSQNQMHALIDQLFACESPYFCPHGRPVIITMDLEEFDRKFKRIT